MNKDTRLIILCVTLLVCVGLVCYTAYHITSTPQNNTTINNITNITSNTTNNTMDNNTTLNNSDDSYSSSASTGTTSTKKKSSTAKTASKQSKSSDSGYNDELTVYGTNLEKTVKAKWIGKDEEGLNIYKLKNGKTVHGSTYYP